MILWIFVILCGARSCIADPIITINGTEVDCADKCVCCKEAQTECRYNSTYGNNYCHKGCVATIFGNKCHNSCKGNCFTCSHETGSPCYTCKDTFYDLNSYCTKSCSVGCTGKLCNNDGTCSPCKTNFKGIMCDTCIQGFDGRTCSECVHGYYGTHCDEPCSAGCVNGTCAKNGTCLCHPNFMGVMCDTCVDGRYGMLCDQLCSAGCIKLTCDKTNGSCACLHNFSGETCEQCKTGLYGELCDLPCSGTCIGGTCSRNDGKCTACVDRYTGDNCTATCDSTCATCLQADKQHCMSCKNGFTGTTCRCPPNCDCASGSDKCASCTEGYANPEQQCKCQSQYCVGDSCNECIDQTYYADNEACCKCPDNCKGGVCKSGPECMSGCIDGFYGLDCSIRCSSFSTGCSICNRSDGMCLDCTNGLYPHVNGSCIICNSNCKNKQCNSKTGDCTNGCEEMFWGNKCDMNCSLNCETCKQPFGMCDSCRYQTVHGVYCNESCSSSCIERICDHSTGHCSNGCIGDYFGNLCQTNCPANCQKSSSDTSCNANGYCAFGCVDGYEGDDCSNAVSAGPPVAAIAGGLSGSAVAIIGVVVALFVYRRRSARLSASSKNKQNSNTTFLGNITEDENKDSQIKRKSTQQSPAGSLPSANKLIPIPKQPSTHVVTALEIETDLQIDDESTGAALNNTSQDDQTYYNELGSSTYKSKIPISQLVMYVDGKTHEAFRAEFEKFSSGLSKPYVESQKKENISKNRYKGIYPYDDSRVKVRINDGSDYINASFIDGYKKPKQYIATLGPMSQQLGDFGLFWKMIWQQKVEKIVMVTNLIEQGSPKCEQYWPKPGTTMKYGDIKVESCSEDEYAEFTRRVFTVTMGSEERTLHHLHFTCWPDKAIPDDVTAMIEFRQRVQSMPSTLNGPTVVHCSAGVGRTGTYIALDILTKEGEAEKAIDISGCVHKMRQNRPNMVQTIGQYQFLHTAVVYSLTFDCKQIKGENFNEYMNRHSTQVLNTQFKHLQQTLETRSKDETEAVERNKQHLSKNRANADIPGNENRPRLYLHLKPGAPDYINAVYIHSFRMKKRYLVAQTPLPETVIDFVTLAVQEKCSCIVSFEADMDKQKNIGIYYPAANQEVLKKGTFQVSCSREENKTFYAERTLTIQHKGTSTYRTISHLQFTDWDEMENIPRSTTNFLSFLNVIDNVMKQQDDGPILVHCFDGAGKSGLFCVVSLLLHKMAVEHEVSVLNAVRKVKTTRRLAIPNQEQFVFCHGCVSEYLRSFDVYANFSDETGQP